MSDAERTAITNLESFSQEAQDDDYGDIPFDTAKARQTEGDREAETGQPGFEAEPRVEGQGAAIDEGAREDRGAAPGEEVEPIPDLTPPAESPSVAKQGVKAYHQFMGAARVYETLYRVKITVREQTNGLRFYDQHSAEIADPDVVSAVQDSPRTTSALRPAAGANINVGDLFRDFNYADGSPVIAEESERLSFNPRFAGDLKRGLLDLWTEERNTLAKAVMQDIEAQRKQRRRVVR